MKIDIVQTSSEMKNEFEVKCDGKLLYNAKLPFISIDEPLKLEKLRSIKIYDTNENEIYTTDYKYVENLKEEFIPLKFLVTGSQKFNQLIFKSDKTSIKIYYEEQAIFESRYVIEIEDKKYYCYSVEDGYIRHFPIYDGENHIGEALKSNIVVNANDEYCCYLKEENNELRDGIIALLLYLDRSEYSSSYVLNRSYKLTKNYSYNKNNKYYDKEWVKNNFGDEFYKQVDDEVKLFKEKAKHPIKTSKEQVNSLSKKQKKLLYFVIAAPWILIVLVWIFILIIMFTID